MAAAAGVVARCPAEVGALAGGVGVGEVVVAEVVDGGDAGAGVGGGDDVGGGEEDVWGMAVEFGGKAQVGPEAGKGDVDVGDLRVGGEEVGWRRLVEVEAEMVALGGGLGDEGADEVGGVGFGAGALPADGAAGVYADGCHCIC